MLRLTLLFIAAFFILQSNCGKKNKTAEEPATSTATTQSTKEVLADDKATKTPTTKPSSTMNEKGEKELKGNPIIGKWYHSHEDDVNNRELYTYRPSTFKFPPSRGRKGIEFLNNTEMVWIGIAPTDGPQPFPGTYKWISENEMTVTVPGQKDRPKFNLVFQEISREKLRFKLSLPK